MNEKIIRSIFTDSSSCPDHMCGNLCYSIFTFTPILKILRADGDLSVYFTEYYRIMLFTYPLMVIGTILGMFIRVDGKPQICMLVSIAGCILNGVLDFFLWIL